MLHNVRHEPFVRAHSRPKSPRLRKKKRMTLVAAFRCGAPDDPSVVVCADSQETHGHYRVTVERIRPRDAGQYDLIVGDPAEPESDADSQESDGNKRLSNGFQFRISSELFKCQRIGSNHMTQRIQLIS